MPGPLASGCSVMVGGSGEPCDRAAGRGGGEACADSCCSCQPPPLLLRVAEASVAEPRALLQVEE